MERESFEDEEVAAVLNQHFVAIKVDREERPDIDQIYMTVCQAMTGEGGWPLTILMTADQAPFFAGTYFPKEDRFGRPGLLRLLSSVAREWAANRTEIERTGTGVVSRLKPFLEQSQPGDVREQLLHDGASALLARFDAAYGGFGDAPKFPTPHQLMFLLRYALRFGHEEALRAVERTLLGMAQGGIYDQIGYGFSRYSTDRQWLVPHFEKMLYDNALLAIVYTEAWQVTRNPAFADIAKQVLTYVLRDMTHPDGGFYCAEDADSEGVEGKFYVWTPNEVRDVLGDEVGNRVCRWFHITQEGNFEGKSIPNRIGESLDTFLNEAAIAPERWQSELQDAVRKLFAYRERRVHPHKDDKILTSWNGLMIAAFATVGRVFGERAYVEAARRALQFIQTRLTDADGRLRSRYRDGHAAYPGYLDDYAFLIWGLIELYEATFEPSFLRQAVAFQEQQLALFRDEQAGGGFYLTPSGGEALIARPKEIYDGAIPSGNSVSAYNLLRLARMTGHAAFEQAASDVFRSFAGDVGHYPAGHTFYLLALQFARSRGQDLVIAGSRHDAATVEACRAVQEAFLPQAVVLFRDESAQADALTEIAPFLAAQRPVNGKVTLYLCENYACRQPTHDVKQALAELNT